MANFLQEKQHDNNVLNYVMQKEDYDSDEGFNYFDQIAQGIQDHETYARLKIEFTNKLKEVKKHILQEEEKMKLDTHLNINTVEQVLNKKEAA